MVGMLIKAARFVHLRHIENCELMGSNFGNQRLPMLERQGLVFSLKQGDGHAAGPGLKRSQGLNLQKKPRDESLGF